MNHHPMRQETPFPTFDEKRGLFELYWMGREEARKGLPLRPGHNLSTAEQRQYEQGYVAGMACEEGDVFDG